MLYGITRYGTSSATWAMRLAGRLHLAWGKGTVVAQSSATEENLERVAQLRSPPLWQGPDS